MFFRNTVESLDGLMKWRRDFQLLKQYEWEELKELLRRESIWRRKDGAGYRYA